MRDRTRFGCHPACLALAWLTLACGAEPKPSDLPGAADLRAGYSIVQTTGGNNAYNQRIMVVSDVAIRGEVIVIAATQVDTANYLGGGAFLRNLDFKSTGGGDVSTGAVSGKPVYFLSRDAGKSWQMHEIKPLKSTTSIYQGGTPGIALTADGGAIAKVFAVVQRGADYAGPKLFYYWAVGRLDLDSGSWNRTSPAEFYHGALEQDGIVYSIYNEPEVRIGSPDGYGNYFWQAIDAKSGKPQAAGSQAYTPQDCVVGNLQPVGGEFAGTCQKGDQTCYYAMDPRKDTALRKVFCAPTAALGEAAEAVRATILYTGTGPMALFAKDAKAKGYAMQFGFGPSFDLGLGKPRMVKGRGFNDLFSRAAVVEDTGGIARVYEFFSGDATPHPLPLPATPCRDATKCPDTKGVLQVVATARISSAEHLVIHDVRTKQGQVLTFGREKNLLPIKGVELETCTPAPAASALVKACYAEVLCQMDELGTCLERWSTSRVAPGAADPALAAFLAADLGKCAALAAADHGVAASPFDQATGTCKARCDGAVAVSCGVGVLDCQALNGGKCTLDATGEARCLGDQTGCDPKAAPSCDAKGRVLNCASGVLDDCPAKGMACADVDGSFRCVPEPDPCAGKIGPSCLGSVALACRKGGKTWRRVDCALFGQQCGPGGCIDPTFSGNACTTGPETCLGNKLEITTTAGRRIMDCTDFAATCGKGSGAELTCVR